MFKAQTALLLLLNWQPQRSQETFHSMSNKVKHQTRITDLSLLPDPDAINPLNPHSELRMYQELSDKDVVSDNEEEEARGINVGEITHYEDQGNEVTTGSNQF